MVNGFGQYPTRDWAWGMGGAERYGMSGQNASAVTRQYNPTTAREAFGFRFQRGLQGYLAHKKRPPPQDLHRALGIGLR